MRIRKIEAVAIIISMVGMLIACGQNGEVKVPEPEAGIETEAENTEAETENTEAAEEVPAEETASETEEAPAEEQEAEAQDVQLAEIITLLGMQDEETAESFGGGEENWTEDRSYYIGRIYNISLYGESVKMHTTCDDAGKVTSISVWVADGTQTVTEEDAKLWADRITEFAGSEPTYDDTTSEAGSKNWSWRFDGNAASLYWLGDTLSFSLQPAVGELQ